MSAVLAIDQGTTGSAALIFSRQGDVIGRAYSEFSQYYPQPGWVEPAMDAEQRDQLYQGWLYAVDRVRSDSTREEKSMDEASSETTPVMSPGEVAHHTDILSVSHGP